MLINRVAIVDLFTLASDGPKNVLPRQGIANYLGAVLPSDLADTSLAELMTGIERRNDEYHFAGKHIVTARKIAWYSDKPSPSNKRLTHAWTSGLLGLKTLVEQACGHRFQSRLLKLYHRGEECLGWHNDREKTPVASLSLGAARRLVFKNKTDKETLEITLAHGELFVMEGETQDHWQHRVPPMKRVRETRINLTFRQVG